jgi:ERF superfamily
MTERASPTLAARLLAVMGEVPYIQKGGKTQSGPSFKYVKHDDVVALVRPALVKHGVGFMTGIDESSVNCTQVGETKSGAARYKTTLVLRLTFMNVDDPSDAYSVSFPGEGVDTDDKGSGKALSYALKNGLLKTFMIEAGDEADNEATTQEPAERPQAVRQDQQREQAAKAEAEPAPNGTVTQAQAKRLHENLFAKGRASKWFLGVIAGKGIGDGEHLTSIPSGEYERLLEIVAGFADPPPPEPSAPAAAPFPTYPDVSAEDFMPPATSTQEPAQEVAAPAAASATSEPEVAPQAAPAPQGEAEDDDGFDVLDDAIKARAEKKAPDKPYKVGSITAPQLTRIGAQCGELERLGVGTDEWRFALAEEFGIAHRDELVKTKAPKVIDYLQRWVTDVKSGVRGPGEKAVA